MDNFDDIHQYVLALFMRPLSKKDKDEQKYTLEDLHKPVLNAGFYLVYREQQASFEDYASDDIPYTTIEELPELVRRDASAWIPDLWIQFLWHPRHNSKLRLEMEATAIIGEIGFVKQPSNDSGECFSDANDPDCETLSRDIQQFGLAFEGEFQLNKTFTFGLMSGYATGRKAFGFQLNEGKVEPEEKPSNFKFDRDYHVDLILFREIIGAVTNATYFKPWAQIDLRTNNDRDTVGARLGILYAYANEAEATPSGKANLGVEFDTTVFYEEKDHFRFDISYGLLVPMDAFDEKEGRPRLYYPGKSTLQPTFTSLDVREAEVAHTIQSRMFFLF